MGGKEQGRDGRKPAAERGVGGGGGEAEREGGNGVEMSEME